MPQQFQAPRGTSDVLPEDQKYWRYIQAKAEETAARFGYERIDTPMFEDAKLFVRGVGETTDIVEKETYTFEDRGGDMVTLRPEGTAPVCRAYLEHGMQNLPQPLRLYYILPMFRYERPQAGRFRQFHQVGMEAIGDPGASIDAEVIEFGWRLLRALGLNDIALVLNSIGDPNCRPAYLRRLKEYYQGRVGEMVHQDCKRRLERNPLRLLDCKQEACRPLIAGAPNSIDNLCAECAAHWEKLKTHLAAIGISYTIDNRLVRGLDYYTRTVFEFIPPVAGSQSTILAGGRYDGLIQELGGKPTPGIGFGMGIERIILNLKRVGALSEVKPQTKVLVAHMGEAAMQAAMPIASGLRDSGITAVLGPAGRSLKSQLRYAQSIGATHAAILGDEELAKGVVVLKDLSLGEQREVEPSGVASALEAAKQAV
ncbi:MAG: histidine--tRNA ligase [SAR202 cluster bacterium]|nr:histidine--tRNA ligase [SAR202 cluster bacterium]